MAQHLELRHDHPRLLALLRRPHIRPVWTPTEAFWLNLIEAPFGALKRFTLANTDAPRMRPGAAVSTPISATVTASLPTCIIRSTTSAHLGP